MLVRRKLRSNNDLAAYEPTLDDILYEFECLAADRRALVEGSTQDQDSFLQSQFNDWNPLADSYIQNHRRR